MDPRFTKAVAAFFVGIPILLILFSGFIALLIWGASRGPTDSQRLTELRQDSLRPPSEPHDSDETPERGVDGRQKEEAV